MLEVEQFSRDELSFLQLWSEQSQEREREKIDARCKHEQTAIVVSPLKEMSCIKRNQESTDRTGHASDARDRAYRGARKHIRDRREEIG